MREPAKKDQQGEVMLVSLYVKELPCLERKL